MSKVLVDHLYHHHLELLQQESQGQFDFIPVDFRTQDSRIENHLPESLAIIGRVDPSEAQYQSAKELALIQTLSAGFEEVDLERAQRYSVQVANNNGANAVSVAEHVLLQILSLFRQLLFHHQSVSQGPWENRKMKNREISGKTLGLIGLGQIGKMVAKYAVSLGMNVQYFDVVRQQTTEQELGLDYVFPETLLKTSDVVSYHVPITSYTRGIINRNSLSMMKPDAVLINSARGELQNEEDLHQALVEGIISGAALDVFQQEPIAEDSPLRKLENVILTPHSAPSRESYPRAVQHAVANLFRLQNNEPLLGLALDHEARARTFQNQHPEVDLMIPNE